MSEISKQEKLDIFYTPEIDYDRNYDSAGYINNIDYTEETVSEEFPESDIIEEINLILTLLPDDMKDIVNKPLSIIETIHDELKNIKDKPIIKEEEFITGEIKDEDNDVEFPGDFFRKDEDPFIIKVNNKDRLSAIKDTYDYDLACIITDYTNKLKATLNEYINNVLIALKNVDTTMYEKILNPYTLSTDKVNKDLKHLSDLIIRSQIAREMNMRLHDKLFSIDKTISHIRACKIGVEQKLRYYEAEYQEESGFNDFLSNRFLENSRKMYDEKYKQNFFNLYKYLNSSVILLNECFKLLINEAQAKIILIEKEGNDLW